MRYAYNIFLGKPEAKIPAEKPTQRRKAYFEMNLKEQ
jgi:hypothetical protein